MRDNGIFASNDNYRCEQCDRSIGPNNNLFLRRARLVISGNVSDHVAVYIQPDFASASGTNLHFAQLRDAYFDLSFDKKKEHRIRAGQSKIPFGFEEMQSSQNRLDLDRTDALNSAFPNERDIGIFTTGLLRVFEPASVIWSAEASKDRATTESSQPDYSTDSSSTHPSPTTIFTTSLDTAIPSCFETGSSSKLASRPIPENTTSSVGPRASKGYPTSDMTIAV